jgi:hypothetical protein
LRGERARGQRETRAGSGDVLKKSAAIGAMGHFFIPGAFCSEANDLRATARDIVYPGAQMERGFFVKTAPAY